MQFIRLRVTIGLALMLGFAWGAGHSAAEAPPEAGLNALKDYVAKPDPAYAWKIVHQDTRDHWTTVVIQLTSQSWRTSAEVDRTLWQHWLTLVIPEGTAPRTAFLFIGGGANDKAAPEKADDHTLAIAKATQSVVAELRMVPNQALVFHGDGVPRKEDDLIGYAWDQFLKSGDLTWLPRLPMVKSVVRAMDCLQAVVPQQTNDRIALEKFVIAGGSKRGWTTWMTGVADPRVAAIVPIVIDVVNVEASMRHHAEVYGCYTEAIGDYVKHGITRRWTDPRMRVIYRAVDPFFHRDELRMPKFIVNAAGDEFFCPDSSQFYFGELQGEKHLRYVPNADHSLDDSDALESITAFYQMILDGKSRPRFAWRFTSEPGIEVVAEDRPSRVCLWQATNPQARDFRLMTIGPAYASQELTAVAENVYRVPLKDPPRGWTASFVEMTFDTGHPLPLKLTTAVKVLPETLPHAGIDPNQAPYEPDLEAKKAATP